MKYIKLFMLLAAVTLLGACSSDDDSWNSAPDVTVSMENDTISIKESMGLTNIPIVVKGKTNGNVYVTVEVKEHDIVYRKDNEGNDIKSDTLTVPAKEDVHYYITDKTINISDGKGNVEVEPVDDDVINHDRVFSITIVDAKGASIGEHASTVVVLKDNDSQYYEKLQGTWQLTGVSRQGEALSSIVKIIGASDEDDTDYNKTLYLTGMAQSGSTARLSYHYDENTKEGYVAFDYLGKYNFLENITLNQLGTCNIKLTNMVNNQLTTTPIKGTWSEDFKEITFDQDQILFGGIYSTGDSFLGYEYFSVTKIKLTRTR